ncbi:MAG: hypothetical protein OEL53_09280 [Rhodospirillales bacterium]|nr:hypothetical protein [Rhodospirillales bacterium]
MLRRAAIFMLGMLALAPKAAIGGEIDPDHFGTWAPVGLSCKAEPRIVVSATEIVIHHQGRVQRFGDLDESFTCASGASIYSISTATTCVTPGWNDGVPAPFWLVFNPKEERERLSFELLDGDAHFFPNDNQLFRKCRHQR